MEQSKAIEYLRKNQEFLFDGNAYSQELINALVGVSDEILPILDNFPFRKPSTVQLIAVFPGSLGVDRLYLGDIKKAALKYITFGGFGIWWIKDILSAKKRCREYNRKKLLETINDSSVAKEMIAKDEQMKRALAIAIALGSATVSGVKAAQDSLYIN